MTTGVVVSLDSEDEEPKGKSPRAWQKYWDREYTAFKKRTRHFYKQGNGVVDRFVGGAKNVSGAYGDAQASSQYGMRLNLFHTNVSTLQSMLYGSTPRIDVSREHLDPDDDIARVAAVLYQRILQADVEPSGKDTPTVLQTALQDRLLPGLGIARVRYEMEATTTVEIDPMSQEEVEVEKVSWEDAPIDYVHWQDFSWGWGRTWAEIPWIGYRSWLSKLQATARFGKTIADQLEYKDQLPAGEKEQVETIAANQENNIQQAEIWEMWHKKEEKAFWFSPGAEQILDAQDDPLELTGFWPSPKPLTANLTSSLFMPTADFIINQDLYNQIDLLQSRIAIITEAVKVVGVYDKSAGGSVGRMLKEGLENDLIPVDNWAMFAEKGGLQGTIDWFPVETIVNTLTTLRSVLGETIELLYQVTGMSDVLRGANTDQYTSDGTNQLKAKFGSIRVQALQDEFARFASDLEGLKAEIISKHFSPETILKQSNAQYIPQADQDKIMPALELMQSPDIKWRIDIRPESIAMIDYAMIKEERTQFLTAMATYIQSAQAAAKAIPESLPILLEMLKWGMAGFKGSDYLEGTMDQAIDMAKKAPPKGEEEGKEQAAMQMQMQIIQAQSQAELQKIQAKSQADGQLAQVKMQGEMQKIQADNQASLMEQQAKGQADMQKIATDLRADLTVIKAKLEADLRREDAQSTFAIAEKEVEHGQSLVEQGQQHSNTMTEIDEQGEQVQAEDND
jgi:hypothetical protein